MKTKEAHFRGSWYPSTAGECEDQIKKFLESQEAGSSPNRLNVGVIAPHAGWVFSGGLACRAISALAGEEADLVILFGTHLRAQSPARIISQGTWETPFGDLHINEEFAGKMMELFDFDVETPDEFSFFNMSGHAPNNRLDNQPDNTIELQLPFVKYFFKKAKIAVIGAPPRPVAMEMGKVAAEIAEAMGLRTKIIGSTDLTHYGPSYGFSPAGSGEKALEWVKNENDQKIIDAMIGMDPQAVLDEASSHDNACCPGAVAAAMAASKRLGAKKAALSQYRTSADIRFGESFVGYAGIVFSRQP